MGTGRLLHDLDIERVKGDLTVHGLEAAKILTEKGVDADIVEAIQMHNEMVTGTIRTKNFIMPWQPVRRLPG